MMLSKGALGALSLWLCQATLLLLIAAGMALGPEIANLAWDQGLHVTPAQAALHEALESSGIPHHHGSVPAASRTVSGAAAAGFTLERQSEGLTFGSPLSQAASSVAHLPLLMSGLLNPSPYMPLVAGRCIAPPTPPPRSLLVFP